MRFHVFDIEWDFSDESNLFDESGLKLDIPTDIEMTINIDDDLEDEEIADIIGDELSNKFGFCHFGFNYKILNN